ncbi:hypothetical protein CEK68_11835 [Xanthomonas sp. LMG 12461]|nr:hypothetical protein CEK68_11835 [Xanthomonas sp. LMG 12461]
MWVKEFTQLAVDADADQADYFTAGANDMLALIAERDQFRAEKQEFREEATRWAEEAGRLKALLHDAQRDAERYRWIRDCTKDGCVESAILDHARYAEVKMGKRLDAAIDAAMATEREVLNG